MYVPAVQPSQLDVEMVLQAHDVRLHLLLDGSDLALQLPEAGPTVTPSGWSLAEPTTTTTPPGQPNHRGTVDGNLVDNTILLCFIYVSHML